MANTHSKASSSVNTSDNTAASLSSFLRQGSQAAHEQIETVPMMVQLGSGNAMSLAAYQRYLCALHGYYQPLEQQLFRLPPQQRPHSSILQAKTPWLEHDLQAIGLSLPAIAALPRCQHLPTLSSAAAAWGVHYVLEGAALGGRVLLRRVSHLPVAAQSCFLQGHGHNTGRYWQAVRQAMDSEVAPAHWPVSLQAALQTFATLEAWLRRC